MRNALLTSGFLLIAFVGRASAEGGCPPGQMPINASAPEGTAQSLASCVPIPHAPAARAWSSRWGAVADDGTGIFGAAANQPSKSKAEKIATSQCKERGGAKCAVYMTYTNQCIALTTSSAASNTARAPDEIAAQQDSLAGCQKSSNGEECRVYYSACSLPVKAN